MKFIFVLIYMKFRRPKGTKDLLPADIYKWHFVENTIREIMQIYDYSEIRTPTFEFTELFIRGVGKETDIVGKEMYTFTDKSGESVTLRPEGTAPVMRAYLENSLYHEKSLHRLYYIANMFRYEKPQSGRYREHTQFGAEIIGSESIYTDVELILLAREIYQRCGIDNFKLKINSIGKAEDRKRYCAALKEYLGKYVNDLSEDSKRRIEKNPMRVLDSKDPGDVKITQECPKILDYISDESRNRFESLCAMLRENNIDHDIDFRLVRGLDYYTDTTFEFVSDLLGAQNAIGGGGRYDLLAEQLGGKTTPAVGFASGLERLILVAEKNGFKFSANKPPFIYLVALGDEAVNKAFLLMQDLRNSQISSTMDFNGKSMKSQLRYANKLNVNYVFIIGDEELSKERGILKNMNDSTQCEVEFAKLKDHLLSENKKSKSSSQGI
jgi:histidyl-tRNA synthetase